MRAMLDDLNRGSDVPRGNAGCRCQKTASLIDLDVGGNLGVLDRWQPEWEDLSEEGFSDSDSGFGELDDGPLLDLEGDWRDGELDVFIDAYLRHAKGKGAG